MDSLVVVKGNEIFTDSMVISDGAGSEHESIMRLIGKHKDRMERCG